MAAPDSRNRAEKEKRDMELHARMRVAHENGDIIIYTNFAHLNRGGSPVFSMADNLGPLLVTLLGSVGILFVNVWVGLTALVAAALFYAFGVRPWIASRLRDRTIRLMLANVNNWRAMWRFGGIIVALADNPRVGCAAPEADWRSIAKKFVATTQGPGLNGAGRGPRLLSGPD